MKNIIIKIDRLSAWILFFVILAYAISGYGMTKGIIPGDISNKLHLAWLGGIGLLAFVIHTAYAIHLFFARHNIWNKFTKILLLLFYIVLIGFFVWVNFFFSIDKKDNNYNENIPTASIEDNNIIFNAEKLSEYNGKNGKPAYVAIDGIVYDMSKDFINGVHFGHNAGQDLSSAFHKKHPNSYLKGLTVVGTYQN